MDGFQQTATKQHKSNGYCEPKSPQDTADERWTTAEGDSGGSDSCGANSVSEPTDLLQLKNRENEDDEDRSDKGLKGDQKMREDEENDQSKQTISAASSYTGKKHAFCLASTVM